MNRKLLNSIFLILFVLIIDQWLKIWVKTTFVYTHTKPVLGDWFELHFIENNGFAFGTEFGGEYGKLALTLFRLVAVGILGWYIYSLIVEKAGQYRTGYIMMVALIFAGAVGNIIDSVFYGVLFSESNYHISSVAEFLPDEGGYSSLFHGRVVDMLHFPLIDTFLPEWLPFWGGERFEFFRPIFNIADSSITAGVFGILLFYRAELKNASGADENLHRNENDDNNTELVASDTSENLPPHGPEDIEKKEIAS
ncbi:MAG: lipoprotein signal peptidase [Bacteroidia bacterium]